MVKVINKPNMPLDAMNCPTNDVVNVDASSGGPTVSLVLHVEAIPEDMTDPVFEPAIPDIGPLTEGVNPIGSKIHSVTVRDEDCKLNGAEGVRFVLTPHTIDCCLIVPRVASGGLVTADIILKKLLDFETMGSQFVLSVTAYNVQKPRSVTKTITDAFTVTIADAKDTTPKCETSQTFYVDEVPATVGLAVGTLKCEAGKTYTYTLVDPNFGLNGATIQIKSGASLDYETKKVYRMIAYAEVAGSTLQQEIHVVISVQPVNEVDPTWSGDMTLTKSESTAVGTVLSSFTVSDFDLGGDGIDINSIGLEDNFHGIFFVFPQSENSGTRFAVDLILIKPLDYDKKSSYTLRLTASDPG